MLLVILVAAGLLFLTIVLHGLVVMCLYHLSISKFRNARELSGSARLCLTYVFVIGFVLAHFGEIVMWATAYRAFGALASMEEAIYFSAITFATIGYGDVTLSGEWRIASAFEGVNGILLFGWTTAFLFKVSGTLWFADGGSTAFQDRTNETIPR
ncbi:potassium channel family protein [Agrobacterium pusense]|uniref:potassium channel family protein n=1 Tax=Agrobacterium pusense TaxID=648995 RepID=UPI00088635FB|nr:potassium channel family protein [Agrobacterium pusense]OOO15793.1 ion transporter [Agrobacterium pusense]WKD48044.1 potassium channel family protein [Agrobacterium pusense]SDF47091.1 Ion channel [Agrobacterium pusense]